MPTKNRAGIAGLHRLTQTIIETGQHNVILVKNMNPMTSSPLNASIPGIRQTQILSFRVEDYASCPDAASNFKGGVILRTVIDYLDLHLILAGVLFEYA